MKIKLFKVPSSLYSSIALFIVTILPRLTEASITYKFETFIKPENFNDLLVSILQVLITIAIPIVVLFIIYSGFMYVTARGNAQQVEQATRSLTYAIIGGVLIIGAVAISVVIKNLVGAFTP